MPHYILDKAYTVNESGGVEAHRAVVQSSAAGQCELPGAAAASKILGVTTHAQSENGRAVAVRKAGIALVEASAAISVGEAVEVADTAGRVRQISLSDGETTTALGYAETAASAAGDLIEVFLSIHKHTEPLVP